MQDWYKRAPTVVTTNICLPLGVDSNTTVRIGRILFPKMATFTPIKVPVAGCRITVQLARCIMLQGPRWPGTQLSLSRADERPISLTCSRRSRHFSSPCQTVNSPSCPTHFPQPRCSMKGKEQHLQLPYSLTSTYCCCNSRSTSHWPALCSQGTRHKGKPWPAPSWPGSIASRCSGYTVASKAHMRPPNCFSTYPALNANYRSPQIGVPVLHTHQVYLPACTPAF